METPSSSQRRAEVRGCRLREPQPLRLRCLPPHKDGRGGVGGCGLDARPVELCNRGATWSPRGLLCRAATVGGTRKPRRYTSPCVTRGSETTGILISLRRKVAGNLRVYRNGWMEASAKAGAMRIEILRLVRVLPWVRNQQDSLPHED